jgi:hypothetical protein
MTMSRGPAVTGDSWTFWLENLQADGVVLTSTTPDLTIQASVVLNNAPWGGPYTPTYDTALGRWEFQLELPGPGPLAVRWYITYGLLTKSIEQSLYVEERGHQVSVEGQSNLNWDIGPRGLPGSGSTIRVAQGGVGHDIIDEINFSSGATYTLAGTTANVTISTAALAAHIADVANPHAVTKAQVGLGNADNTSDANKPVSTAQQTALDLKANDSAVVHTTGAETVAGVKTFSSTPLIPDDPYGAGWDGSLQLPTKNAVYDKIQSLPALVDGDKGDITVSGSGTVWTVDNDAITYAKLQNVSATDKLLGRATAGAGDVEEIALTAFARSLIDDADALTARATLGAVIGTNVQAWDTDLDAIAALAPSNDDIVQRKAGAWTNRTLAQVKTDLAYNLDALSDVAITSAAQGHMLAHNGTQFVNRLGPVYNVKDYGALGDGSTDDATAINAARLAATTTKGTVYFPPGTYIIGAAITGAAGVTFQGAGKRASVLKRKVAFQGYLIDLYTPAATDATVIDLGFDGNYPTAAFSGSNGINAVLPWTGTLIARCRFSNPTESICVSINKADVRILDCDFVGTGVATSGATLANTYGVWSGVAAAQNTMIDGCDFKDFNWAALLLGGSGTLLNCRFTNNHISVLAPTTGGAQIGFESSDQHIAWRLVGNYLGISGSAECNGIEVLNGIDGIVISGNTIEKQSNHGIAVGASAANVVITDNVIRNNVTGHGGVAGYAGVAVSNAVSGIVIADNRIFDDQGVPTQTNGVLIGASVTNYTVIGNDLRGNVTAALNDAAGTGVVTSNLPTSVNTAYQNKDTELTALAGLTSAADRLPYFTGSGTAALATFTAAGRALVDDADAAAQRATLAAAPVAAKYIVQTADSELSAEQALGGLATGIVKNTTTTGVLSIAAEGTDYWKPGGTDVAVADGGTGGSTAAAARTNLGAVNIAGDTMTGDLLVQKTSGIPRIYGISQQAAGFTPPIFTLNRTGAAATATPDNSAIGDIRFDGLDAAGTPAYTEFAAIAVTIGTNAAGGAPSAMGFRVAASGATAVERAHLTSTGLYLGGAVSPTAVLHLAAGVAAASGAPLKLTSGTNLTAAEAGAFEFDGAVLQFTDDTAGGRGLVASEQRFKLDADGSDHQHHCQLLRRNQQHPAGRQCLLRNRHRAAISENHGQHRGHHPHQQRRAHEPGHLLGDESHHRHRRPTGHRHDAGGADFQGCDRGESDHHRQPERPPRITTSTCASGFATAPAPASRFRPPRPRAPSRRGPGAGGAASACQPPTSRPTPHRRNRGTDRYRTDAAGTAAGEASRDRAYPAAASATLPKLCL